MGFRFRKSIKVAPGVKLNLGKKGASVTVGNKYARTTIGNGRKTVSASIPGTGVSYVKQTSTKSKTKPSTHNSNAQFAPNGNGGPNQQMEWKTAFKIIKWAFYAFLAFFILMMSSDSKAVFIGAAVIVFGMILTVLKKKGTIKFKQTRLVSTLGWILTLFIWVANIDSTENNVESSQPTNETDSINVSSTDHPSVKEDNQQTEPIPVKEELPAENEPVVETSLAPVEQAPVSNESEQIEHFNNCKEMNAVYPNGVPKDHPAYSSARDRDNDGWACER